MSEEPVNPEITSEDEITSDDKLWALLTYIFTPLVPIIILLMEDKKGRPFIKAHNAQALVVGVINVLLSVFLGWTLVLACVPLILWLVFIYWGVKAYQGEYVTIPVVTDWVKNQGWA